MRKKIALVFIALTALAWVNALNTAAERPKKLAEHLEQAAEKESQGIYVDAISEYEAALEYTSDTADITYSMAKDYLLINESNQYISLCKELIENYPDRTDILDELMNYYVDRGDDSTAVKYVMELVENNPENEGAQKWLKELKGGFQRLSLRYDGIVSMQNDYFLVYDEDSEAGTTLFGVMNASGKEILDTVYEEAQVFSDSGYALVTKDGQTLYVDSDGNTRLIPDMTIYSEVSSLWNNRVVACKDGFYGLLSETLNEATDFSYEELTIPANGFLAAKNGGKWGLIGTGGKEKTEYLYDGVVCTEAEIATNQERVFVMDGTEYIMLDGKGDQIGDSRYEDACAFQTSGYAAVCSGGKWGYVNSGGEIVIDYQFDDARSFNGEFAAVCVDDKWGFIDTTGTVVISTDYDQVTDMTSSGTAGLYLAGEWTLIQLNIYR